MDREDLELAVRFLEATDSDERTPALREQRHIAGAVMYAYGAQQVMEYQRRQATVAAAEAIARNEKPAE